MGGSYVVRWKRGNGSVTVVENSKGISKITFSILMPVKIHGL